MKMLRRGTALILSLALVFSLVAVVATPNWTNRTSLGMLSRYYETGSMGDENAAGVISTVVGDPGGKSYGAYMFTIKSGTVLAFINWCRNTTINSAGSVEYAIGDALYSAYTTGGIGFGPLFDETWARLAAPSPSGYGSAFFRAQEAFSKTNIYDVAIDKITKTSEGAYFNIDNYSVALKNVIWSRAVHHGPEGAKDIVVRAFNSLGGFANQAESDIIMAIYNESGRVVTPSELSAENGAAADTMKGSTAAKYDVDGKILRYWYGSSASVQEAVYRRLNVNEPADALRILQSNAFAGLSPKEGNYTVTLRKDASTLALGVVDNAVKVVNTAGENPGTAAKFTLHYLSGVGAYTINTAVGNGTMRLAAGTADSSGFGAVTLAAPSTSDSQLWYIDNAGKVTNKATGTYLAYRNDTLVMVGTDGAEVTSSSTSNFSAADEDTATTADDNDTAVYTVTFIAGANGSMAVGESTSSSTTKTYTPTADSSSLTYGELPAVTVGDGWSFTGWFTKEGVQVKAADVVTADTVLYAHYTHTTSSSSSVLPSAWTFSPVVKDASDFAVDQLIYPDDNTELHEGDSGFPVRGMISCSGKITRVELTISGGPTSLSDYATPNASYYDLGKMDSTIAYSALKQGSYTYKLTATVDGTAYTLKESTFKIGAAVTPDATTPSTPGGDTFTVTFDAGSNGKCTTKSQTYSLDSVIYGSLPTVSANSGWGFAGWFTAPTGGVEVLPGTQIVAENITLYAQYTRKYSYTFTGASGSSASGSAAAGTVFYAPSSSEAPWKAPDGNYTYTFSHWVDSSNNKYSSGQAIVMGEGNMTFTPVYTQKSYTTVTPSTPGGGGGGSATTSPSGPMLTMVPGMSVSQVTGTVYSGGKVVTSGVVATGMTVKSGGSEFVISVTGDASGDGKITVTDVVKLQSHLLNKSTLSGAYLKAADLNADGNVTITDLVKAARVVAGKDTIG